MQPDKIWVVSNEKKAVRYQFNQVNLCGFKHGHGQSTMNETNCAVMTM